ncbi:unnamed protein product [Nezara viridula]|uniref:Uncharacterized protein n=1 Tax=Nezara viridula TaxID=85310 RepID=A0A9P0HUJ9_NEZVI|nr:unnamed protein product [Nezara viridula]
MRRSRPMRIEYPSQEHPIISRAGTNQLGWSFLQSPEEGGGVHYGSYGSCGGISPRDGRRGFEARAGANETCCHHIANPPIDVSSHPAETSLKRFRTGGCFYLKGRKNGRNYFREEPIESVIAEENNGKGIKEPAEDINIIILRAQDRFLCPLMDTFAFRPDRILFLQPPLQQYFNRSSAPLFPAAKKLPPSL